MTVVQGDDAVVKFCDLCGGDVMFCSDAIPRVNYIAPIPYPHVFNPRHTDAAAAEHAMQPCHQAGRYAVCRTTEALLMYFSSPGLVVTATACVRFKPAALTPWRAMPLISAVRGQASPFL